MRTPCCLVSVSALLVGALALGNPFLPARGTAKGEPVREGGRGVGDGAGSGSSAPFARREPRAIAPFALRAAWQEPRALPRRSPLLLQQRTRMVLPRDVGFEGTVPAVVPASYRESGADDGSRPQ